jgi:hypothetical protein
VPLPGQDWLQPNYGSLQPLPVQRIHPSLFRVLGITASGGFAPLLLPTVQAVVPLHPDPCGVQAAIDGVTFWNSATQAAVVGQLSQVQLFNATQIVDLVVTHIGIAGAGLHRVRFHTAALAVNAAAMRNKLLDRQPSANAQIRTSSSAAGDGTIIYSALCNGTEDYQMNLWDDPVIVPPGFGIHVHPTTANQAVTVSFRAWERPRAI